MFSFLFCAALGYKQFGADFNFRIHNRDGWVGPKTKFEGHSGFVLRINNFDELQAALKSIRKQPEVIVIPLGMLTKQNIDYISKNYQPKQYLQAIMVLHDDNADISPDAHSPNHQYSFYENQIEWNKYGDQLMYQKTDVPIIYPTTEESVDFEKFYEQNKKTAGLYVRLFMISRSNSQQCLKDATCKPIGGLSMYGSFTPEASEPGVWAITNFDAFGEFPYGQVGADYSISGYVTLLAALESLKGLDWTKAKYPLRFAFFDAEETGYMGSTKFLSDIESFECKKSKDAYCLQPFRVSMGFQKLDIKNSFEKIVEVKSVADTDVLYAHGNKDSQDEKDFLNSLTDVGKIAKTDDNLQLPPSSLHSFLKKNKTVKHVLFTGYNNEFTNKRVGSPSDCKFNADNMQKSATTLANTLIKLCEFNPSPAAVETNKTIIDELMKALIASPDQSQYVASLFPGATLPTGHISLYSGVYSFYTYTLKQRLIDQILRDVVASNTTDVACTKDDECEGNYMVCSHNGKCEHSFLDYHPAYSNAIEYDYDKEKFFIVDDNPKYPLETEANWDSPDMKFVLIPSFLTGRISCGVGIFLWAACTFFFSKLWNFTVARLKK